MYSKINKYIKDYLASNVSYFANGEQLLIQTGYLGDFNNIDLRRSAILLEPRTDKKELKNVRWKDSKYTLKLWIMVAVVMSYEQSLEEVEQILGADDQQSGQQSGLYAALDKLMKDPTFASMSGTFSGKTWRIISGKPLSYTDVSFGITQNSSSQKINTATLDLVINFEQEK